MERVERNAGQADIGLASAAIDDGGRRHHVGSGLLQHANYIAGAAAGGDYVFYDHDRLIRQDLEAAAQEHGVGRAIAFGEEGARSECAGDFMADDNSANRGRDHQRRRARAE